MSNQPRALELASLVESGDHSVDTDMGAADLLRLQHEVIGELVDALETGLEYVMADLKWRKELYEPYGLEHKWAHEQRHADEINAALARAKELEGEK